MQPGHRAFPLGQCLCKADDATVFLNHYDSLIVAKRENKAWQVERSTGEGLGISRGRAGQGDQDLTEQCKAAGVLGIGYTGSGLGDDSGDRAAPALAGGKTHNRENVGTLLPEQ